MPPRHPLRYLGRHAGWISAGVLCLLLTNGLAQSIPWVVRRAVDAIAALVGRGAAADGQVLRWALVIAALAVGQAVIRILSRVFIFNAGREAEYELRKQLFEHLCTLDGSFYRRYRTGDLMSRLTNDLSSVRALFGAGVLHSANTLLGYAVALPLMLRIDARLTLWALAPYPLLLLGARQFARGIYDRSQRLQRSLAAMNTAVQEDLAGIRELRAHRLEAPRARLFEAVSGDYLDQAVRLAAWRSALLPFVGLGAGASTVLVLWIGGRAVIEGGGAPGAPTLGDLVAINLYVGMLAWPTMAIGWVASLWQRGIAAWQRLHELLAERSVFDDDDDAARAAPPPLDGAAVEVRRLSVELDGHTLLRDISFSVPPGSLCGVVGRLGSGKTVLAEALARLVQVPRGAVLIGGVDVRELPLAAVRDQIAYAPQDAFLFSATLAENVAFGLSSSTAEQQRAARVAHAARAAGLDADIARLPDGLQTVVGERGVALSGGQRQRVALARALAADRPLLILDDSLSSVDADTEREILAHLRGALAGRTALIISHRLSALQHADQIIVLERGRLVERGGHAELLARGGAYAQLYRQQLLEAPAPPPEEAPR